ncbi:MAG: ABC transporter ATP-binding protein [Pseudorhodoplanes sp.]|jgi:iron complex transport system ATP-binding protein|nr:ABC transporter ATP-binding protein [Pseudorhodoplanes sp.]
MSGAPMLTASNLSVRLDRTLIVSDASLTLRQGQFTALVGPNGAGKTTLVRALAGVLPCDGAIHVEGRPLAEYTPRERAKRIAYLPQGNTFHWPMPVEQIVALGRYPHGDPFSPPTEADKRTVAHALEVTGTQELAHRPVTHLSGGEKARVALARALATEARILLADEPTMSLDPRHQLTVMDLLRDQARKGGAVLAVVHDLALAARYADRIIMIQNGRISADEKPQDALNAERIASVFGIEATIIEFDKSRIPVARRAL